MLARKCVMQTYSPSPRIMSLMTHFKSMVNDCLQAGILNDCSTLRRLSRLTYSELKKYPVPSYYRLCAISKASGILSSRKKSLRRGIITKNPYMSAPNLVSCYGFVITENGMLRIPIDNRVFEEIELNRHTLEQIWSDGIKVNSFSLSEGSLSLCISKNVEDAAPFSGALGVDGNSTGLIVAGGGAVLQYDLRRVVKLKKTTAEIISSVSRRDNRIRRRIAEKYTKRRMNRTAHILHSVTRDVVDSAKKMSEVIVFAETSRGTGRKQKFVNKWTNAWQFGEVKREIEYKARWNGTIVLHLRKQQMGDAQRCPACGERLPRSRDRNGGAICCPGCNRRMDNPLLKAFMLSESGWVRFAQSLPQLVAKGGANEAMEEDSLRTSQVLRVDASKLASSTSAGRTEIMHVRNSGNGMPAG